MLKAELKKPASAGFFCFQEVLSSLLPYMRSYLDGRLHVLCFVETASGIRVISFHKANDREVKIMSPKKNHRLMLTEKSASYLRKIWPKWYRSRPAQVIANQIEKIGRPVSENKKQAVSIRLDPDVLEAIRATGDGWQTRVNEVLRNTFVH